MVSSHQLVSRNMRSEFVMLTRQSDKILLGMRSSSDFQTFADSTSILVVPCPCMGSWPRRPLSLAHPGISKLEIREGALAKPWTNIINSEGQACDLESPQMLTQEIVDVS